jgi:hypothetical protein
MPIPDHTEIPRHVPSARWVSLNQAYAYAKSGDEANALAILAGLESRRITPGRGYAIESPVLFKMISE